MPNLFSARPVVMPARVCVRVHAKAHGGNHALGFGQGVDDAQLGCGFYVEAADAGFQTQEDFPIGLSYTCEDDVLCAEARVQRRLHLAAAYAVGAEAGRGNLLQQFGVMVGFHGIVHLPRGLVFQLRLDGVQRFLQEGYVVVIEGRLTAFETKDRE